MVIKKGLGTFFRRYSEIIARHCHAVGANGTLKPPATNERQLQSELNELLSPSAVCYDGSGDVDTLLFPLAQHASVGLTEESKALPAILNGLSALCDEGCNDSYLSGSKTAITAVGAPRLW